MRSTSAGSSSPAVSHMRSISGKGVTEDDSAREVFVFFGALLLLALFSVPAFNAVWTLLNPVYSYFLPAVWSWCLILTSVFIILMWFFFLVSYFKRAPAASQTEQSIILIMVTFLVLAGAVYLVIGDRLISSATLMGDQVWTDCESGAMSRPLYNRYQELLNLRMESSCSGLVSVEDCGVDLDDYEAKVVKSIEKQFMCAGYCVSALQVARSSPPDAMSLLQTSMFTGLNTVPKEQVRLALHGEVPVPLITSTEAPHAVNVTSYEAWYPPTLFSQANFQVSCDGLVARRLYGYANSPASHLVWIGISLIVLSIFLVIVKLPIKCGDIFTRRRGQDGASNVFAEDYSRQ